MDDPNEKIMVSYRIPRWLKLKFDTAAKGHGISGAGLIRQLMEFAAFTDPEIFEALIKLAQKHNWLVEQRLLEEGRRNVE